MRAKAAVLTLVSTEQVSMQASSSLPAKTSKNNHKTHPKRDSDANKTPRDIETEPVTKRTRNSSVDAGLLAKMGGGESFAKVPVFPPNGSI